MTRMTRPAVVVGSDSPAAARPSVVPALVAAAAIVATVAALQAGPLRTAGNEPPPGLQVVETRTWQPSPAGREWTLSRVYAAPDGRGLAVTARRGAGNDLPGATTTIGGAPAVLRAGGAGEASLLQWNHLGFGYTIVAVGMAPEDLIGIAEGVVYDRTGLGTMAVPRPGDLPAGLMLLDQRSGPSAGPGTGPTGTVTVLEGPTGARITVTSSRDAVVSAAHLSGMLRLTTRGSEQLAFTFPGAGADEGLRWLVADRGATTVVVAGTGVTAGDLARALAAAGTG